jgi:hypothetical protein
VAQELGVIAFWEGNSRHRPKVYQCEICAVESYEMWIDGVCETCINTPYGREYEAYLDSIRFDKAPPNTGRGTNIENT